MIERIGSRLREYFKYKMKNEPVSKEALVKKGEYYVWEDLDCNDTCVAAWQGMTYLHRTKDELCKAISEEDISKLKSAFVYWLDNDFQNSNWWYSQIGVPMAVCDIVILLEDRLSKEELDKAIRIIEKGSLKKSEYIKQWTGANLIWGIWTTAKHALIEKDGNLLKRAVKYASREVRLARGDEEGIKPDFSFFQHGTLHYTLGYGRSFTVSLSLLVYILSGSEYQLTQEKLEILVRFLLEGQAMMMRGRSVDYLAIGREYCRINSLKADEVYDSALLLSETVDIPCYQEQLPLWRGMKILRIRWDCGQIGKGRILSALD